MVLIAAEMLAQNPGLGKFVWDEFQNGSSESLSRIMVAVFTIGIIGFLLDRVMLALQSLQLQRLRALTRWPSLELQNVSQGLRRAAARKCCTTSTSPSRKASSSRSIGFSGSGKTTLISTIAGLIAAGHRRDPASKGKPIAAPGPDRGVVFQSYSLMPWLTVLGNIALAVDAVFAKWTKPQRRARTSTST